MSSRVRPLLELASLYGVQRTFKDVWNRRRSAPLDSICALLRAMGVTLDSVDGARDALIHRQHELARRGVEPVVVAWNGQVPQIELTVAAGHEERPARCTILTEDGQSIRAEYNLRRQATFRLIDVAGHRYVTKRIQLPNSLDWGYHALSVETAGGVFRSHIIAAPSRAYGADDRERTWGTFLPLYALRSERNWGAGDFTDLESLCRWTAQLGGTCVGTLPLSAAFLDQPFDPSPYSPVSRLFWNEFYIDIQRIPEWASCPAARRWVESTAVRKQLRACRASDYVEYRSLMTLKRRVLEQLCSDVAFHGSQRSVEFHQFLRQNPLVDSYARFRATCQRNGTEWPRWPLRQRLGRLRQRDYDQQAHRYYLYAQWICTQQMDSLFAAAAATNTRLYLDMPLGVRRDGFDVWRWQNLYALDATVGSPPDAVFTKGQEWGFCPLHPDAIRQTAYQHVRQYLAHHLRYARQLRIDHVMALHRLYWIPPGCSAESGVYVRYRSEELYAILSIESHRHRATIVGENLGTVPAEVNRAMDRHGIRRMFVVQYEMDSDSMARWERLATGAVASMNTHDMPPFAAWWKGYDIRQRIRLGLLDGRDATREFERRQRVQKRLVRWLAARRCLGSRSAGPARLHQALLRWLAASDAECVLVNLEDLWQEIEPQNVPGTGQQLPNWQRKCQPSFEQVSGARAIRRSLTMLNTARRNPIV